MKGPTILLLSGNEAVARAAVDAGVRFFAGYPITPSSEIAEELSAELPRVGGVFIQMEDEIASMGAVIGASLAGRKSMTATSGPGFSLKQENLGYAAFTEIPCVVVNVMRGGPSTGLPTLPSQADVMQARWGTHGDHPIIAVIPATVPEAYSETVRAVNLAEKYRVPVIVLLDEIVSHTRERIDIPEASELRLVERARPTCSPEAYLPYDFSRDVNPLPAYGEGYRFHVTGLNHDETGFPTSDPEKVERDERRLLGKIERNREDILLWDEVEVDDAEILIVSFGSTSRAARRAVKDARSDGLRVGLFRPITLWPFPEERLRELAGRVHTVVTAEMNLGQMAYEVERIVCGRAETKGVFQASGEPIHPQKILSRILEVAESRKV